MRSQTDGGTTPPGGLRRALLWAVLAMALLFALSVAILQVTVHSPFDRAVARYKAAGMPWTADEVIQNKVQAEKDAGPRLFALAAKFKAKEPAWLSQRQGPLTPKQADELEAYLKLQNKLLDEYRAFAHLDANWNKDWDEGMNLLMPEFSELKAMTRALAARMELRSYRGDLKGSLEDLRLGARLVRQPGRSSTVIGALVGISCGSLVGQAVLRSASHHLDSPIALGAFAAAAEELKPDQNLARAIRGDSYAGLAAVRNYTLQEIAYLLTQGQIGGGPPPGDRKLVRSGTPNSPLVRALTIPLFDYWSDFGEAVKTQGDSLDSMLEIADKLDSSSKVASTPRGTLVAFLAPLMRPAALAAIKSESDHRNLLAALRIAELQALKGSITQAEVAKLLPEDPFTHEPMKVELKGGRIKLWSLGPDETDEGGISRQNARGGPYDLPLELPWRPAAASVPSGAESR